MKVVWTQGARTSALECAVHIANDDPVTAARWFEGLTAAVDRLARLFGRAALGRASFVDERVVESRLRRETSGRAEGAGLMVLSEGAG